MQPQDEASLVIASRAIEALLSVMSPAKRVRFLRALAEGMKEEERLAEVAPLKQGEAPSPAARAKAAEWFRRSFNGFAAKVE